MPDRRSRLLMILLASVLLLALPALCWVILGRVMNPPIQTSIESRLCELYDTNRFADVVSECERAEGDPQFSASEPRILYIEWASQRQLGNAAESDRIKETFLQRFPDHPLAAEFHFAEAMELLADQKYQEADVKLVMIEKKFPTAQVTNQCTDIRKKLDRYLADTKKHEKEP